MKKILLLQTAMLTAGLLSYASSFSQLDDSNRLANVRLSRSSTFAGSASLPAADDKSALADMKKRNEEMFNHFTTDFPNATNIRVHPDRRETLISCLVDGDVNKLHYSNKGKFMSGVHYYDAEKLSDQIKDQVLDAYPRYSIFGFVAEVHAAGKTGYFIMIKNGKSWKRIRLLDNNIDTYEEYEGN